MKELKKKGSPMKELKINPEYQALIPSMTDHERECLEAEIRFWGQRYSLNDAHKKLIADIKAKDKQEEPKENSEEEHNALLSQVTATLKKLFNGTAA